MAHSLSPWAARAVRVAGRVARSLTLSSGWAQGPFSERVRFGIRETPAEINVEIFGAPRPAGDAALGNPPCGVCLTV